MGKTQLASDSQSPWDIEEQRISDAEVCVIWFKMRWNNIYYSLQYGKSRSLAGSQAFQECHHDWVYQWPVISGYSQGVLFVLKCLSYPELIIDIIDTVHSPLYSSTPPK